MRVGLIADHFSVENGSGIGRYSEELLTSLTALGVAAQPLSVSARSMPLGTAINHTFRLPRRVLAAASEFDLLHATNPAAGLAFAFVRRAKVVTFHDLMSLLCASTDHALYMRVLGPPLFKLVARWADQIIADSTQTKRELLLHLGIAEAKVKVVCPGVGERFRPAASRRAGQRLLGYLGAIAGRKRVDYALRALAYLVREYPDLGATLWICGGGTGESKRLAKLARQLHLAQRVEFKGWIPEQQLVGTYNSFDVLVLPSEWEGFGLPILEAQRCGVPVIITDDAHIAPEVSSCCLKAFSEHDMADKIYRLCTDADFRRMVVEQGLEYSQRFTWERTAQQTLQVYEEALARR